MAAVRGEWGESKEGEGERDRRGRLSHPQAPRHDLHGLPRLLPDRDLDDELVALVAEQLDAFSQVVRELLGCLLHGEQGAKAEKDGP